MKLMTLLPFMDQEDIQELVQKIKNKEVKGVRYIHLFPFLDREEVDQLVDSLVEDNNAKELYGALPFMSQERLNRLYDEVKEGKVEGFKEHALLPFLGKAKIKDLVNDVVNNSVEEALEDLDEDIAARVEKAVDAALDK